MSVAGQWQSMLPDGVRVEVSDGPIPGTPEVEAQATQYLPRAVAARRAEFVTGRMLAARALAAVGSGRTAVGRGDRREPVWPDGFVGAITHRPGVVAAVAAPDDVAAGLGIDVEVHEPLPPDLLRAVASETEQQSLVALPAGPCWSRILFSAKESVYKVWYPQQRCWLGFLDVQMQLFPGTRLTAGTFEVDLPGGPTTRRPQSCRGSYRVVDHLVLTALSV